MSPLKVYLCDLTHETVILVSDTIPLNLGFIGSYAKKIHGKTPLIYSSELLKPIAYKWQTQINENAKYPAYHAAFSEMNHNEILSFRAMDRTKFLAILLRDENDHPKIKRLRLKKALKHY